MVPVYYWWLYPGSHSGSIERPHLIEYPWVGHYFENDSNTHKHYHIEQIIISPGITTVLTMTFMGLEARKDLPKVTYPTALDYFVFISFMYIFSTVVQVIHCQVRPQVY